MKKIFYILAVATLATLMACEDDAITTKPQSPLSIAANDSVLVFPNTGGAKNIGITATGEWTAAAADNWVTATKRGGQTLRVEASANSGLVTRETTVTVSSGALSVTLKVRQTGTEADIIFDKATYPLRAGTDTARVLTISTVDYTISIPDSSTSWVSVIGATTGTPGEETKELQAAENITARARTAVVLFQQTGDTLVKRITLSQAAPSISLSVPTYAPPAAGGSQEVTVTADVAYDVTMPAGVAWVAKDDLGNDSYKFTVTQNTDEESRSATIVFKHQNGALQRTFTITQNGASVPASVGIKVLNATASGNYNTISLPKYSFDGNIGNGAYWESNTGSNDKWITYELDQTNMDKLRLESIIYYPRLPNSGTTTAAHIFKTVKVSVSYNADPTTFVEVLDIDNGASPDYSPKTMTLTTPLSNVHSVKFVMASTGTVAVREMVFRGIARRDVTPKFVIADRDARLSAAGNSDTIGVATNCGVISATSDQSWCNVSVEGNLVIVNAGACASVGRNAIVTVTGDGVTTTFNVRQMGSGAAYLDIANIANPTMANGTDACAGTTGEYGCESLATKLKDRDTSGNAHWHSRYDGIYASNDGVLNQSAPVTFEFTLDAVYKLSHIRLFARFAATPARDVYGNLVASNQAATKIEVKTAGSSGTFTSPIAYNCGGNGVCEVVLPAVVDDVEKVQIIVHESFNAGGGLAFTEVEFWGGL